MIFHSSYQQLFLFSIFFIIISFFHFLFHLQDNSSKWAEAVEKNLGRMLSAFVVTSAEDQNTLMNILRKLKCDQSHTIVCQGNDPAYSVQSIPNAHTVCDAITVENNIVFNCLLDQAKIDQTILVHDDDDCSRYVTRINGQDGFSDHRIKSAYTSRGTKIEFRFGNQVRTSKIRNNMYGLVHTCLSVQLIHITLSDCIHYHTSMTSS